MNGVRHWAGVGASVARVAVGGLLVVLGLSKAVEPVGFLKLLREYQVLETPWLLNSAAVVIPWLEVFLGLLLVCGVAVRGTALVLLGMLAPFTVVVLRRALELQASLGVSFCAVQFDCGCGMGVVWICPKLVENGLMMGLCLALMAGAGRRGCARYHLFRSRSTPQSEAG